MERAAAEGIRMHRRFARDRGTEREFRVRLWGDTPNSGVQVRAGKTTPFTSEAKYMATEVSGDYHLTLIKGAPERIIPHCAHSVDAGGQAQPLARRAAIDRMASGMVHKGIRLLAAATSPAPIERRGEFQRLTFVALIGIKDPLRPEAAESVRALQEAGVQVVMITGDNKETAEAIARDAKLLGRAQDLSIIPRKNRNDSKEPRDFRCRTRSRSEA